MPTTRTSNRGAPSKRRSPPRRSSSRYWSAEVTKDSNALDLECKVFSHAKPEDIARSLKRSDD